MSFVIHNSLNFILQTNNEFQKLSVVVQKIIREPSTLLNELHLELFYLSNGTKNLVFGKIRCQYLALSLGKIDQTLLARGTRP